MKIMENSLVQKQLRQLTELFFHRFFDSEMFATPHADMHLLFVQILALLVMPGVLKTLGSINKYLLIAMTPGVNWDQAILIDTYSFLVLSMILTGFITVFEWDALFPDDKDIYNLTPLPIKPRTLFFAKVLTLSLFVAFTNIAINGVSTVLFPGVALSASGKPSSAGIMYTAGHGISLLLSSVFVFTLAIAVRALFSLLFPARFVRAVSRYTQLALILLLLCAFLTDLQPARMIMEKNPLIYWLPSFWFLGLYEVIIGHHDFVFSILAKTACTAVLLSFVVAILSYVISYLSSMQKGFQSSGIASLRVSVVRKTCTWILHKTILKGSSNRALFHFVAQTLFRRREHFLYCGSFVMVGIALIYSIGKSLGPHPYEHLHLLLSFPLIMSYAILVGLRFAFSVPADLNANWLFKTINKRKLEMSYGGIQVFMFCAANIPLLLVFVPFYLHAYDIRIVGLHVLFASVLSFLLIKLLLFRFDKLPFACSYIPGKANLRALWLPYLLSFFAYAFGTTGIELWLLHDMKAYIIFILIVGIAIIGMSINRSSFLRGNRDIQFEEEPEQAVYVLTIEG
jgi:hypothetical protein